MKKFWEHKYFKYALVSIAYVLWVIWVGSYWLLVGLPVIYDMYVSKKVNWTFWKKREGKNHILIEWLDALIFAVIAVSFINIFFFQNYKIPTGSMEQSLLIGDHLYVSKVAYGPRIPNTPLSLPFFQNRIGSSEAYLEWIKLPYKKLKGFRTLKNDDPVVFNFPAQDTAIASRTGESYYSILLDEVAGKYGVEKLIDLENRDKYLDEIRKKIHSSKEIIVRPVDKRDNYIKRCIAIPGDSLMIINGQVYINGKPQKKIDGIQYHHKVITNGASLNMKVLNKIGISESNMVYEGRKLHPPEYDMFLTSEMAEKLQNNRVVDTLMRLISPPGQWTYRVFPNDPRYPWNPDNFGPLWIPKKGETVSLTLENLPLYKRIINAYENNELAIKDSIIYINGEKADSYTFKMDYYWMMGDNRHNSLDARFWGYVPEDHIVGRPVFVWLSIDKNRDWFNKHIRLRRMFMRIK